MEKEGKPMQQRNKRYTEEFRRRVVNEWRTGPESGTELSHRYGLSTGLLWQWSKKFEQEEVMAEPEEDSRMLKARVAELERMVGRLAMENDFLKKFAVYTKQQTNERSSIVTAKSLASRKPAGSLGLPAAATTTSVVRPAIKTLGSKPD
jgi:transposase